MKPGDTVQLKHNPSAGEAKILFFYSNVYRGEVRLDRKLGGLWSWNVEDLCKAEKAPSRSQTAIPKDRTLNDSATPSTKIGRETAGETA